jgi:hypothetical protein
LATQSKQKANGVKPIKGITKEQRQAYREEVQRINQQYNTLEKAVKSDDKSVHSLKLLQTTLLHRQQRNDQLLALIDRLISWNKWQQENPPE